MDSIIPLHFVSSSKFQLVFRYCFLNNVGNRHACSLQNLPSIFLCLTVLMPFLLNLFFPIVAFSAEYNSTSCVTCHADKGSEFSTSIHFKRGYFCTDCHGGDPNDSDLSAMALEKGFKGKVHREKIPQLCASCHSDVKLMKPFGLPTDQLREYQTSQHGMLLSKGDTNVAVCTDCHSVHKILPPSDTESSVHKAKLPQTCSKCHSDEKLMSKYNIPYNQYEDYRKSVHGKAVLEAGNLNAANCASCHSNHGALPPGVKDIGSVCGQCHSNTRDMFVISPHKKAMDEKKMSECVACHSNHDIKKPTLNLLPTLCLKCHTKDTSSFKRGEKIFAMLTDLQNNLNSLQEEIKKKKEEAVDVEKIAADFDNARTGFMQLAVIQHSLSIKEIEKHSAEVKSIIDQISVTLENFDYSFRKRKLSLFVIWGFVGWAIVVMILKIKKAEKEQKAEKSRIK